MYFPAVFRRGTAPRRAAPRAFKSSAGTFPRAVKSPQPARVLCTGARMRFPAVVPRHASLRVNIYRAINHREITFARARGAPRASADRRLRARSRFERAVFPAFPRPSQLPLNGLRDLVAIDPAIRRTPRSASARSMSNRSRLRVLLRTSSSINDKRDTPRRPEC